MKQPRSSFAKQRGFTLMESLIALVLFAIIILGSGTAIKSMLTTQKEMNIGFIVVNEMQKRLQDAQDETATLGMCARISTNNLSVAGTTFYIGCSVQEITVSATQKVEWPVLAASSHSLSTANGCATGTTLHNSCFVVGR